MDSSNLKETPTKKEIALEYLRHVWLFVKNGLKGIKRIFVNIFMFEL